MKTERNCLKICHLKHTTTVIYKDYMHPVSTYQYEIMPQSFLKPVSSAAQGFPKRFKISPFIS